MRLLHATATGGLILALALPICGCRGRSQPSAAAAPPGSVAFELSGSPHLARGALLSKPPGREEGFLAFVAGGSVKWVDACREEAGGPSPLFSFQTDAQGAIGPAQPASGGTPRERCLAARAVETPGTGLPPATQVTVQLVLR